MGSVAPEWSLCAVSEDEGEVVAALKAPNAITYVDLQKILLSHNVPIIDAEMVTGESLRHVNGISAGASRA